MVQMQHWYVNSRAFPITVEQGNLQHRYVNFRAFANAVDKGKFQHRYVNFRALQMEFSGSI